MPMARCKAKWAGRGEDEYANADRVCIFLHTRPSEFPTARIPRRTKKESGMFRSTQNSSAEREEQEREVQAGSLLNIESLAA